MDANQKYPASLVCWVLLIIYSLTTIPHSYIRNLIVDYLPSSERQSCLLQSCLFYYFNYVTQD